jgi:hypothetical protein
MAVNETRSMNADLREGLTDGSVRKLAPSRGGEVENAQAISLRTLHSGLGHYDFSVSDAVQQSVAVRSTSL